MPSYEDYPSMDQDNAHHDEENVRSRDYGGGNTSITDRYFSNKGSKAFYTKWWFWAALGGVVILAGAIGTGVAVAGDKKSSAPVVGTELPRPEVSQEEIIANKNLLGQKLLAMYTERGMDWSAVKDGATFQGRALDFVCGSSQFVELSQAQNVERYALTVFYLATYRQPNLLVDVAPAWNSNRNWLSKESVCVWEGLLCNAADSITSIQLPNHSLSGSLPLELSLLTNLETLDFTTNFIYMEGEHHTLWSIMPYLRELTMDDNFFVSETGLPPEFAGMDAIEKISLSYNLLQGTLDGSLFTDIETLEHLEIESNYISGVLPDELLVMPNLVYLYARRNAFEFALPDVIRPGNLANIFALWLDGNLISGGIPTEIGLLTDLASLSITDSGLGGSLPTELGLLTGMRRCWLYNNQLEGPIPSEISSWTTLQVLELYGNDLSGTVPEPVCSAVGASDYEFKTLSADCDQVTCTDCCTDCYEA